MPYIPVTDKYKYSRVVNELQEAIQANGISNGELNWLMTILGLEYLKRHGKSYNTISDVIKAFECAKLEFYRRVAAPYEDHKATQNGDVYEGF